MGLFDSLAGSVIGKLGGERGTMVQIAMDLLNKHGGVSGVLAMFKEKGYTEQDFDNMKQDHNRTSYKSYRKHLQNKTL